MPKSRTLQSAWLKPGADTFIVARAPCPTSPHAGHEQHPPAPLSRGSRVRAQRCFFDQAHRRRARGPPPAPQHRPHEIRRRPPTRRPRRRDAACSPPRPRAAPSRPPARRPPQGARRAARAPAVRARRPRRVRVPRVACCGGARRGGVCGRVPRRRDAGRRGGRGDRPPVWALQNRTMAALSLVMRCVQPSSECIIESSASMYLRLEHAAAWRKRERGLGRSVHFAS